MRRISAFLIIFACGLSTPVGAQDPAEFERRWNAWGEISGAFGSNESSLGGLTIFLPVTQSPNSLVFTEFQATYFEGDILSGNAALGYRKMTGSGFNFGIWGGLDVSRTDDGNTFGQVSAGLEALSEYFDARINGHLPFSDAQTTGGTASAVLKGSNIFIIGSEEVALYGVDGEIGGRLPLFGNNAATLGLYGGGFWFDHDDVAEEISGYRTRLELNVNDIFTPGSQLTAQYAFSHDNVRGDRHFVGGALRIPLGPSRAARDMSPQEWRMIDGLERETGIVTSSSTEEPVEDALTGVDFDKVTMASDAAGLNDAVNAGGNNLIILSDAGGVIDLSSTEGQALLANQTLQGGGSTIKVRGRNTGVEVDFTAPGTRPTLFSDDTNEDRGVVTIADNTHLAGLNIRGSSGQNNPIDGNDGIKGDNATNVVIEQTDIRQMGDEGIQFVANNSDVHIRDVFISDVGDDGIDLDDTGNTNFLIENVELFDIGVNSGRGIDIGSGSSNIRIEHATIVRPGDIGVGISGSSDVVVQDVLVEAARSIGIFLNDENSNVLINDVTIASGGFGTAIGVSGNNTNVNVEDVAISDGFAGIEFYDSGITINVSDTTFAGTIDTILLIRSPGNVINGANNPNNATVTGSVCNDNGLGFTGTIAIGGLTFVNGC